MPFVQRNSEGVIIGLFANIQPALEEGQPAVADEWLEDDDPAVVEALKLPVNTKLTPLDFLEKFTDDEQLAVVEATQTVAPVKLWYDKLLAATYVDLSDPRTVTGLSALVAAELLTDARKEEILNPV